jgi:MoxR-like ATPase
VATESSSGTCAIRRFALAATIREDQRELDEELEAAQLDRMLGLRVG